MKLTNTVLRYSLIILSTILLLYLLHITWGIVVPSIVVGIAFYGSLIILVLRYIIRKIQSLRK